jgi:hypothetical protein
MFDANPVVLIKGAFYYTKIAIEKSDPKKRRNTCVTYYVEGTSSCGISSYL